MVTLFIRHNDPLITVSLYGITPIGFRHTNGNPAYFRLEIIVSDARALRSSNKVMPKTMIDTTAM